jgi:hypothetical protein
MHTFDKRASLAQRSNQPIWCLEHERYCPAPIQLPDPNLIEPDHTDFLERLAKAVTIAFCPKCHAAFGFARLQDMLISNNPEWALDQHQC